MSGPHSYNGRGIKYAYRVIVATQRLNQSICSLKLPFRVISVANLCNLQITNPSQQQLKPTITNPFLVTEETKESGDKSTACILNLLQEPSARYEYLKKSNTVLPPNSRIVQFTVFLKYIFRHCKLRGQS